MPSPIFLSSSPAAPPPSLSEEEKLEKALKHFCKEQQLSPIESSRLISAILRCAREKNDHLIINEMEHLTTLPVELFSLSHITHLDLEGNALDSLPQEIGNLKKLHSLRLLGNQLTHLPCEIGELPYLKDLDLSCNALKELPESLGQLRHLHTLKISFNSDLSQLPSSLRDLEKLSHISCRGTKVSDEKVEQTLFACRASRGKHLQPQLPQQLSEWAKNASSPPSAESLQFLLSLKESEKSLIAGWLDRLTHTQDYRTSLSSFAFKVFQVLGGIQDHPSFRETFFEHTSFIQSKCGDLSAMEFCELYSCWLLHDLQQNGSSPEERFQTLCSLAKVFCLRKVLSWVQENYGYPIFCSAETHLFYELLLQPTLSLPSVIKNMTYPTLGKQRGICPEQLANRVEEAYLEELIALPAFHRFLQKDPSYQEELQEIENLSQTALDEILQKSLVTPLSSLSYKNAVEKVQQTRLEKIVLLRTIWAHRWLIKSGIQNL